VCCVGVGVNGELHVVIVKSRLWIVMEHPSEVASLTNYFWVSFVLCFSSVFVYLYLNN
jgi:hypothetical protein